MSWLSLEIARVLHDDRALRAVVSYSAENELASDLAALAPAARPFSTFRRGLGALARLPAALFAIRRLVTAARRDGATAVVVLMSHVWTPFLGYFARRAGLRYVVIVHEARGHPGDPTGRLHRWTLQDIRLADRIVTLTEAVAADVAASWNVPAARIVTLAHPVMRYGTQPVPPRDPAQPLRVLFFGRIMAYKGLGLLIEATEMLRREGVVLALHVVGEGEITPPEREALARIGAAVANRWVTHAEIGGILAAADVVVLPYREASQSGVVAAAFGVGRPVVVTPVGGLAEQVRDGVDGLVAPAADAAGLADALRRLAAEPKLYARLRANAERHVATDSVAHFVRNLIAVTRD